jgi:hypothetical protein
MAAAGVNSHGNCAKALMFPASCSIVPQLAVGSAKPKPTNERVVSARTKAGMSMAACVAMKPRAAGRRWRPTIRSGAAPEARAASA